jgi:membrane protease YdiL (CAAX protease family)
MQKNPVVNVFWNYADRRLRALWRIFLQAFVWFNAVSVLTIPIAAAVVFAAVAQGRLNMQDLAGSGKALVELMGQPGPLFVLQSVYFLTALATVWLAGRFLDRRPFADFGFHFSRRWWIDFAFGLFLGALLMACVFLAELAAGWVEVTGFAVSTISGLGFPLAVWIPIVMFLFAGISEELIARGYQIKNYSEGMNSDRFGPRPAILAAAVLSSIFFGFLHAANPNISLVSVLNLMAAGIFLAAGYILTGELAVSIGIHITWNVFQGNVFGFQVSGMKPAAAQLLAVRQGGPDLLTGGAFGPEGGLIGLGAMLLGCALIVLWVRITRGRVSLARSLAESPVRDHPGQPNNVI